MRRGRRRRRRRRRRLSSAPLSLPVTVFHALVALLDDLFPPLAGRRVSAVFHPFTLCAQ
jgi:hypothetical protein